MIRDGNGKRLQQSIFIKEDKNYISNDEKHGIKKRLSINMTELKRRIVLRTENNTQ